jgi:5-(carboxyamino)imidazole ribonucleotide synthase
MGPLGILGGGQLGRMTLEAASALGLDVVIAERFSDSPAARMTARSVLFQSGTWDDSSALDQLANLAPVVTLENEFVDAYVLESLESRGCRVLPKPTCVRIVQDKLLQKEALLKAELPVPPFAAIDGPDDILNAAETFGWPMMLKARRDGYDGRGNVLAADAVQAKEACKRLGWPERALFAEAYVPFERELAGLVVRGLDGSIVEYPIVDTQQDPALHICRTVLAPAEISAEVTRRAAAIARAAVEAVDGVGAFGVELFLLPGDQVCINELAPRPHNSAHYSIEACITSQFLNHVRAVLGLPLGSSGLRSPAACMVNLLGSGAGALAHEDVRAALRVPETFAHLYGKSENRPGRKLGHVTALGRNRAQALERAQQAASCIHL